MINVTKTVCIMALMSGQPESYKLTTISLQVCSIKTILVFSLDYLDSSASEM